MSNDDEGRVLSRSEVLAMERTEEDELVREEYRPLVQIELLRELAVMQRRTNALLEEAVQALKAIRSRGK